MTWSRNAFFPLANLCANRCSYCTFRKDPDDPATRVMSPEEIHRTAVLAARHGCKEALMCLGDRPERVHPHYRRILSSFGYATTVDYVYDACRMALDHGLLPHTNAGVLEYGEMKRLKEVNVSLGLMLENVSPRLRRKGMPHYFSPDKDPALRLRMLREAGELAIPFTTGILVGIGETHAERMDSLLAIREIHERYGHIQEVIIQNFRAKPGTPMGGSPEPDDLEVARTVASARLLLGNMNIQAPPNLNSGALRLLLRAGINDWGGISPIGRDYINPEAAWPDVDRLAEICREEGCTLRERLAVYPEYIDRPGFLSPALRPRVLELQAAISA